MEMTTDEIVRDFRGAKDKRKQMAILADLNLCTIPEIKAELEKGGVNWRELPRASGARVKREKSKAKKENEMLKTEEIPKTGQQTEKVVESESAASDLESQLTDAVICLLKATTELTIDGIPMLAGIAQGVKATALNELKVHERKVEELKNIIAQSDVILEAYGKEEANGESGN